MAGRVGIAVILAALALSPVAAQKKKPSPPAAAPTPPPPSVKQGVNLWRAGDWPGAVTMWRPYAEAGDPDAMFNMGQAYKLGRGVTQDRGTALTWYRKAAAKEHLPAQANLGILLFQNGEKPEAVRWLKTAADRGEMRAQYVLGIVHWNGDGAPKSMPLAYAYLARSADQGMPEAKKALADLTGVIAPQDRANGWAIATSLSQGKGIPAQFVAGAPATVTAAASLPPRDAVQKPLPPATPAPPAADPPAAPLPPGAPPVRGVALPAATSSADKAKPAEKPAPADNAKAVEKPPVKPTTKTPPKEEKITGWRVQLGAFGKKAQAETAWTALQKKHKAEIGKAKPIYAPGERIVKLQMGPYKTKGEARAACEKLEKAGKVSCFATED